MKSIRTIAAAVTLFGCLQFASQDVSAQGCPMCKSSMESSIKEGSKPVGRGVNYAILYLLAMPFAAIGTIGGVYAYKARQRRS